MMSKRLLLLSKNTDWLLTFTSVIYVFTFLVRSESFSVGVKAEMPLFPPNRIYKK